MALAIAIPPSPRPSLNSPLRSSPALLSDEWQADFKKMLTIRRPDGHAPLLERSPAVSQQVVPHARHDHDLCQHGPADHADASTDQRCAVLLAAKVLMMPSEL